VIFTSVAAAFATFCVVQDQVTRAGAERYVRLQQDALAGRGPAVRIDDVMRPAVERSVKQGLIWGGVVLAVGLSSAVMLARRDVRLVADQATNPPTTGPDAEVD
jgi:hypothetical protein